MNPSTNTVYVGLLGFNSVGNGLAVVNGATNTVTTTIPGFAGFDVAVNSSTNKIYVATGGANVVKVIDGATNTVTTTVAVGSDPEGVAVNPTTNRIYVANRACCGAGGSVSVIDGSTDTVTATLTVGNGPAHIGINTTTNTIYVSNNVDNTVAVINGATNALTTTVPVGSSPFGVAVNSATNKIYVGNYFGGTVSVIDGSTNIVVANPAVSGASRDAQGVAANASTNTIYAAQGDGSSVSVIDGATNTVTGTVAVGSSPRGVAVNASTNTAYVANQASGTLSVITNPTPTPTNTATSSPTATRTMTGTPTATATSTATPEPAATSTPVPVATSATSSGGGGGAAAPSGGTNAPSGTTTSGDAQVVGSAAPGAGVANLAPGAGVPLGPLAANVAPPVDPSLITATAPAPVTAQISAATTNTVAVFAGNIVIVVPPGALSGATSGQAIVDVKPAANVPIPGGPAQFSPNGSVANISITDKGSGQPVTIFPVAIPIQIQYNAADVAQAKGDPATLTLSYVVDELTPALANPLGFPVGTFVLFPADHVSLNSKTGSLIATTNALGSTVAVVTNPVGYVQTLAPDTPIVSSFDPAASQQFGTKPQFSYLQVVEPQIGTRLLVLDPDTGNYAYVNAVDVGPAGAPPPKSSSAVVRGFRPR